MQGLALGVVEGGDGEKIGQEEDAEGEFDFPEDGFDNDGQRRVEEAAQISRHVEDGLTRGVDFGTVRNDGGDFGDAGLAEAGTDKFDDGLFAESVKESGDGEGGRPFNDGAEEDVVDDFAPGTDDAVEDDVNKSKSHESD